MTDISVVEKTGQTTNTTTLTATNAVNPGDVLVVFAMTSDASPTITVSMTGSVSWVSDKHSGVNLVLQGGTGTHNWIERCEELTNGLYIHIWTVYITSVSSGTRQPFFFLAGAGTTPRRFGYEIVRPGTYSFSPVEADRVFRKGHATTAAGGTNNSTTVAIDGSHDNAPTIGLLAGMVSSSKTGTADFNDDGTNESTSSAGFGSGRYYVGNSSSELSHQADAVFTAVGGVTGGGDGAGAFNVKVNWSSATGTKAVACIFLKVMYREITVGTAIEHDDTLPITPTAIEFVDVNEAIEHDHAFPITVRQFQPRPAPRLPGPILNSGAGDDGPITQTNVHKGDLIFIRATGVADAQTYTVVPTNCTLSGPTSLTGGASGNWFDCARNTANGLYAYIWVLEVTATSGAASIAVTRTYVGSGRFLILAVNPGTGAYHPPGLGGYIKSAHDFSAIASVGGSPPFTNLLAWDNNTDWPEEKGMFIVYIDKTAGGGQTLALDLDDNGGFETTGTSGLGLGSISLGGLGVGSANDHSAAGYIDYPGINTGPNNAIRQSYSASGAKASVAVAFYVKRTFETVKEIEQALRIRVLRSYPINTAVEEEGISGGSVRGNGLIPMRGTIIRPSFEITKAAPITFRKTATYYASLDNLGIGPYTRFELSIWARKLNLGDVGEFSFQLFRNGVAFYDSSPWFTLTTTDTQYTQAIPAFFYQRTLFQLKIYVRGTNKQLTFDAYNADFEGKHDIGTALDQEHGISISAVVRGPDFTIGMIEM